VPDVHTATAVQTTTAVQLFGKVKLQQGWYTPESEIVNVPPTILLISFIAVGFMFPFTVKVHGNA
jgi:hypothetical protein